MRAGTLVVMASGDRKLRVKVLDKDTPHRGFSQPLLLNLYAQDQKVTPNYLLWYLSHGPVREYLLANATGSVILRVSRKVLLALPVPLPTRPIVLKEVDELVLSQRDDPFSRLIDALYHDYILNLNNNRFRTSIILAGAIAEIILYQLLTEQDINQKVLADDRNLGLGKMLDYIRLLKLDQVVAFPLTHLVDLQKKRNSAIHATLLVKNAREFSREDLSCFDQIIKHFGL